MASNDQWIKCPVCETRHVPMSRTTSNDDHAFKDGSVYASTCIKCGHFFKFRSTPVPASTITITVNGTKYVVGNEYSPSTALNGWLREKRVSVGTKNMCYEGGCGACLVEAKLLELSSGKKQSYAVNSCLVPLYACDGWEISTVEHLGTVHGGLHPIQAQIASYNGTQCGYCTPGHVMNILTKYYGSNLTKQIVENSFDGVLCRCTGYRPILSAFKAMASTTKCGEVKDIEDIKGKLCKTTGNACTGHCSSVPTSRGLHIVFADTQWFRPTSSDELMTLLKEHAGKKIRLLFGNTSTGVYGDLSPDNFDVVIDVAGVMSLYLTMVHIVPYVMFGANMTLSNLVDMFTWGSAQPNAAFMKECADLLSRVANLPIRNRATWTGNICMKHAHPEFTSDVFVMLQVLKVLINIGFDGDNVNVSNFLDTDIEGKVITAFGCDLLADDETIKFYKVMPRQQNSHSYVTGGFRVQADKQNNFLVKSRPVLAYAGIGKAFNRATKTEAYLNGKQLGDVAVLQNALAILKLEVVADVSPSLSSVQYRTNLALSLFYKFVLHVLGHIAGSRLQSGAADLYWGRPVSSGQQTYDTNKVKWPVTEPLQKREANAQATGEALFVDDLPPYPNQLQAAFVLSTVGNAKLVSIDATEALRIPGVVKVITAADIKGTNNFCMAGFLPEEVLVSENVLYCGQPAAIVLAESFGVAMGAREAVRVSYTDIQPPLVDMEEAIQKGSFFSKPCDDLIVGNADEAIANSPKKISGSISMGTQYHFHMETQDSLCVPTEDSMEVYVCSQWLDFTQNAVSQVTGKPKSSISVQVKRLGGAFGAKYSRNGWVAASAAISAQLTNRPVKHRLTLQDNMAIMGKRVPYIAKYQAGFSEDGVLNGIKVTYYGDCGSSPNENNDIFPLMQHWAGNAYYCPNWTISCVAVKTNLPSNAACRCPGAVPAIFTMESIMEHVAKAVSRDTTDIRMVNLFNIGQVDPLSDMPLTDCQLRPNIATLQESADYTERVQQVTQYNKLNRWKKKGISLVPLMFGITWKALHYGCQVAIYAGDATVAICHGGVEMGQGINTKMAQVCAYEFDIPMTMVSIRPTNSFVTANGVASGGSITTELCGAAIIECCKTLVARMAPVKAKLKDPTWQQVVNECYNEGIDLSARFWTDPSQKKNFQYYSYGATIAEVELDILTGEHQITRVDMLYDCGQSTNPALDIGQVEGAYVMGLGYWLTEQCKYDSVTGALLTDSTWEYKPPSSKDIPVDFRVHLQKKSTNPKGVLGAKACAEPPLCMSCCTLFALKRAIEAARREIGKDAFFPLDGPATVEACQLQCLTDPKQFILA